MKVKAFPEDWYGGIKFYIYDDMSDGRYVAKLPDLERSEEGAFIDPTFRMDYDEAQTLIDELWQCGLRPTEGAGSAGSLKATENHLEDMREIAFKKLGIEK